MPTRPRLSKLNPTPQKHYLNRRQFMKAAAVCGTAAAAGALGYQISPLRPDRTVVLRPGLERAGVLARFGAARNATYNLDTPLTDELVAATHNNFYEFTTDKDRVWRLAQAFEPDPWSIEVTGACHKPRKFDIDDIFGLFGADHEERTYRFRCVEAWAMDVPWTGFELNRLLKHVEPKGDARFVRILSIQRDEQMPGIKGQPWYPWPYFEALRMDEAMHGLTLLATGIYGRPLPRQHGAPFRLVVPWKYGYKSPKSIVKIELTTDQPRTFWNTVAPDEYDFLSNVNPEVPHPRWSQARERLIGTGDERPTLMYGGMGSLWGTCTRNAARRRNQRGDGGTKALRHEGGTWRFPNMRAGGAQHPALDSTRLAGLRPQDIAAARPPSTRHGTASVLACGEAAQPTFPQMQCPRRAGVFKRQTGLGLRARTSQVARRVVLVGRS